MSSVVIEGGGIAGQVLRKELSARGVGSRLVERAAFPRQKVCGGVLQWDSWQYLKERFSLELPVRSFSHIAHVWRGTPLSRHRLPKPMVYVSRFTLDEALSSNSPATDGDAESLRVNARGAEGAGEWLGFQAHTAPVEDLAMHYGRGICAGIAPTLEGPAHLAFIVRRDRFRDSEGLRAFLRAELGIEALGAFKGTGRIHYGDGDPGLAVGDAKMTTFPFLGWGMKHAVLSARLLAESIARGEAERYPARHRRRFFRQRWIGSWIGRLYDSPFQGALAPFLKSERSFLLLYGWLHA